jgi:hypothetical protein
MRYDRIGNEDDEKHGLIKKFFLILLVLMILILFTSDIRSTEMVFFKLSNNESTIKNPPTKNPPIKKPSSRKKYSKDDNEKTKKNSKPK